jgi:putative endonuclease
MAHRILRRPARPDVRGEGTLWAHNTRQRWLPITNVDGCFRWSSVIWPGHGVSEKERAGLRILDRNWRCAEGEIDIVAAERQVLVICEVKTRSSTQYGSPFEAITRGKRARLRRLAVRWLVAHGLLFDEVRIDVIGLVRDESGHYQIEHVRGVG